MNVIGIVGWKNSGKTILVERLVTIFAGMGLRVSTVKHAHHQFDIDRPGKDSYRHRAAGAREVLIASAARWALMRELRGEPEPSLDDLLARLSPADLVIVEGFKSHPHPKIEVRLAGQTTPLLAASDANILAIATDGESPETTLPVLPLNRPEAIAAFILKALHISCRDPQSVEDRP